MRYVFGGKKWTGFGWDSNTCTITTSEDHCAKWITANPREWGLRKKGLPHFDLCTTMFSASIATINIARPSTISPLDSNDDDELERGHPTMEHVNSFRTRDVNQCSSASKGLRRKGGRRGRSNKLDSSIGSITACSEAKTRKLEKIFNDDI
ncbi:UNVERIFIED_CONTAM: hypothetical protein Sradi_4148900 [Sesamum radiatum]|uniref:Uncharacterized protein n=1 Tax=Sesamum radiatum TaxID=300843 RepID=A0AAW2P1P5_SESRA